MSVQNTENGAGIIAKKRGKRAPNAYSRRRATDSRFYDCQAVAFRLQIVKANVRRCVFERCLPGKHGVVSQSGDKKGATIRQRKRVSGRAFHHMPLLGR